jgi:hypothetical protein
MRSTGRQTSRSADCAGLIVLQINGGLGFASSSGIVFVAEFCRRSPSDPEAWLPAR